MSNFNNKETHPNLPLLREGTRTHHAELDSASHSVILRCQRHFPIRCWYNFKLSLQGAKNLNSTPLPSFGHPLPWRGNSAISALPQGAREKHAAFTLAEVLITLGIIGVVAALTIPNIISKYNEIVYMAHLKKMVAILETTLSNIYNETGSIPDTFRECHNLMGGASTEAYSCFEDMIIKYAPLNPNTRRVNKLAPVGKPLTEYGHSFFYHRLYLPDGSVIALQLITNGYVIFGFDVNGDKGPNKAGVDLYNIHYYPYQKTGKAYKTISSLNWIDINGCKKGDTQACFATLNHYNFNIPKDYPHKF